MSTFPNGIPITANGTTTWTSGKQPGLFQIQLGADDISLWGGASITVNLGVTPLHADFTGATSGAILNVELAGLETLDFVTTNVGTTSITVSIKRLKDLR